MGNTSEGKEGEGQGKGREKRGSREGRDKPTPNILA